MKIYFSPYTLRKKIRRISQDEKFESFGSLIKLVDPDGCWGVSDLCPWPSLGDLALSEEFASKGKLFRRAFELAEEDLLARKEKRSLLQNKWIKNNILIPDITKLDIKDPVYLNQTLKIKADKNYRDLIQILNEVSDSIKIRIDFNASLSFSEFQSFIDAIKTKKNIEYIEDPTPYDQELWSKWNKIIPLAADFIHAEEGFTVRIIKPSREKINLKEKFTITSAMDHAVGVAHALRFTQVFARNDSGLLTLNLYEPSGFDRYFIYQNLNEINFSDEALDDFGIGMTDELHKLEWKEKI